jgi:serine/threonine protein kinase/cytochrome c-type biogenesis protein CcmH/NrfG
VLSRLQAALAEHYRIDRELGRGGMAVVYLAHDLRHDRPVALKVLHPELAQTLGTDRFLREIKLAARLQHPHIVSVHDSGTAGQLGGGAGFLWFTMPYIEGESLRDRLRREHQLPIAESVRITREVALALDFAHRHGIIHRDIKPENILLLEGHALVADFGIGRALDAASTDDQITNTGFAVGTPAYMSPEQAMGERDIDGRTDVYSLGVVLYEMLAGEPPFGGPTAQAIAAKRMTGEVPSLRRLRPSVPESLERVVLTALAPIPADRFATPGQFAQALSASTAGVTSSATTAATRPPVETKVTPASRRRPSVPAWLTFVLGLMVTASMGMFLWSRSRRPVETAGMKMLAVLPFKNMGAAGDQYFADGLTEEITSRLAGISDLGVVSRTSADQYKGSTKSLRQIGQELGVGYVLEGSVRWEKSPDGSSRVRVTPQLIRVTDDRHLWADRYDAELADVFQVQSSIAEKVTGAMNLALDPSEQRAINERPTTSTEAYDYYLRGIEYRNRGPGRDNVRNAIKMNRNAIALDSNFAQAWAGLSTGRSSEFWFFYDRSDSALAEAKAAADRAILLRPDLADAHVALGYYYYWGKLDYDAALKELAIAARQQPNNVGVIFGRAAIERRRGHWPEALANFQRTYQLDPRSTDAVFNLAETYALTRKYDEALRFYRKGSSINPDEPASYMEAMQVILLSGAPLDSVRQTLREALEKVDFIQLARALAGTSSTAGYAYSPSWLLTTDSAVQPLVEQLRLPEFGDSVGYYTLKAELRQMQHRPGERVYLDSARTLLEAQVRSQPTEASYHGQLGMVYAYLGRKADAVSEGETAVRLLPVAREAYRGVNLLTGLARIYAVVGRRADAIEKLEYLVSVPSYVSPASLRVDPRWAMLRGEPRFQKLVSGKR